MTNRKDSNSPEDQVPQETSPDTTTKEQEELAELLSEVLGQYNPTISFDRDEVSVSIQRDYINLACQTAKDDARLNFNYLRCLSVVEYPENFQVVYHIYSMSTGNKAVFKVDLPVDDPKVPSVTSVWAGADWHEREGAELFGLTFNGHPNLRHLLLYDGFDGFPLRKSFPFNDYQEW